MLSARKSVLLSFLVLLAFAFHIPSLAFAQAKSSSAKSARASDTKKTGFTGDPARKRGLEIGYDMGKKAAKADLEQNLKPDPKRHEAFQKPEKYHRSEYGSQANFVSGFKSGFLGGYQAGFGKKVPISASGTSISSEKAKSVSTPTNTKHPTSAGSASDAL